MLLGPYGQESVEIRIGSKVVLFEPQLDGAVRVSCFCTVLKQTLSVVLTEKEAREVISRRQRAIQEVLPNINYRVREIFLTGLTPAEFDISLRGKLSSREVYARIGYQFEKI